MAAAAFCVGEESKSGKAKLRWAKIDGLSTTTSTLKSAGQGLDIGRGVFASISLFGRRKQQNVGVQEVDEAPPAPYSAKRGTYAYEALQRRFKELDKENTGRITENDLKLALKKLNLPASEKNVQDFLEQVKGTTIPFDQFAQYAIERENLLYDTFKEIDRKNTGYLTSDDLKAALQKYNFRFSDAEVRALVQNHAKVSAGPLGQDQLYDFADYRSLLMTFCNKDLRDANEVWGRAMIDLGDLDTSFPISTERAEHRPNDKLLKHLFLGAGAAAITRTLVAPLERLKILSMVDSSNYSLREMWRDEGVRGLLRGNLLNIARIVPTRVTEFFVYNKLKDEVLKKRKESDISNLDRLLLGTIASMAGAVVAYPLDTLRTGLAGHWPNRHTDDFLVKSALENSGLGRLYKGITPNLARAVPYAFITFSAFDTLQRRYRKKFGPGREIQTEVNVLFGIVAAIAAQTICHPLEVVQRKLQVEAVKQGATVYGNALNAFRLILEKEGVAGLYAGLPLSYAKIVPAAAISVVAYKALKDKLDASVSE